MRNKIIYWVLCFYLLAAFGDYLAREGLKQGLVDKILWRNGFLPITSLAKGLLWPIHIAKGEFVQKSFPPEQKFSDENIATYFATELNKTYKYPLCDKGQCVQSITSTGNSVLATYLIALPNVTKSEFREKANQELCKSIQEDFPDKSMKWIGSYYLKDGSIYTKTEFTIKDCPKIIESENG